MNKTDRARVATIVNTIRRYEPWSGTRTAAQQTFELQRLERSLAMITTCLVHVIADDDLQDLDAALVELSDLLGGAQ